MNTRVKLKTISVIGTCLAMLSFPFGVFACQCAIPSICLAYSRANKVFAGKILSTVVDENDGKVLKDHILKFKVLQNLKGEVGTIETIKIMQDSCVERSIEVGDELLVFADSAGVVGLCNRTSKLDTKGSDFIYALNSLNVPSNFSISGSILGLTADELKDVTVNITSKSVDAYPRLDEQGLFKFDTTNRDSYTVRILIPFNAYIETESSPFGYEVEADRIHGRTVAKYKVQFRANSCDEREIKVARVRPSMPN
jgi:hypothetical protein